MFTPLLDALILFTLTTPLAGLIGRRIKHEKMAVATWATVAFVFSLMLVFLLYSEVLWGAGLLIEHVSALPPEGVSLENFGVEKENQHQRENECDCYPGCHRHLLMFYPPPY